jgi:3-oxoadipate enol-lactonase
MPSVIRTSDHTDLFFQLDGPADADVVCLSHCFGSDHRYWDCHLPAVDGYRILRYDTRGHGQSDCPPGPYTLQRLATDVIDLINALSIDKMHFVGVSMGGMIGQTLALQHADRLTSLTLANSPCHYSEAQVALWLERSQLVSEQGIAAVKEVLMQRWFTDQAAKDQSPGYVYIDQAFSRFSAESFAAATAAICQINTTEDLRRISLPVLLFGSPDDPGVPVEVSELMADRIPDSTLHWLAPSRHLATLECVEDFNRLLQTFLSKNSK